MMPPFQKYTTAKGETLLYVGEPDLSRLDALAEGPGDIWHSSLDQGYRNAFPELMYQTSVLFWYLNDADHADQSVCWRVNPSAFVVRERVWEFTGGFDADFGSDVMKAFDFGFRTLRYMGIVPMYVKGLFAAGVGSVERISRLDRHLFFRKNFKIDHAIYLMFRVGFFHPGEWRAFLRARKIATFRRQDRIFPPRPLRALEGRPSVSYLIPTMMRQDHTATLLGDLAVQTYPPTEVIIVDATPEEQRREGVYAQREFPFEVKVFWQTTKGSCRARNEAIAAASGDYFVFGDDDVRVLPDFIENHIRLLQTYGAGACNGLDIRADHQQQDLSDLREKLATFGPLRFRVGAATNFSNANSCVASRHVRALVGNDVNFDGGYGEDTDFGMSLARMGVTVLLNPFSPNLHLKPPVGGYRWWGAESRKKGKKRKTQPWELGEPVGYIRPVPSPTVLYGIVKQFTPRQVQEYRAKYLSYFVFRGSKAALPWRLLQLPYKLLQFRRSLHYARRLMELGPRHR